MSFCRIAGYYGKMPDPGQAISYTAHDIVNNARASIVSLRNISGSTKVTRSQYPEKQ
jgi:hypothetical protein